MGASDVVLRMEAGGGFTFIGAAATETPSFTLYGDGTLIARDDSAPFPDPAPDGLITSNPFFAAKLSEAEVQELLRFALGEGALGIARAQYETAMVTDMETTTFTVNAGGIDKSVAIYALDFEDPNDPDALIKKAFMSLRDRMRAIAADLPTAAEQYAPDRWRGVLIEAEPGQVQNPVDWPWPAIGVDAFTVDPQTQSFPSKVLSAEEVEALELDDLGGGVQNAAVTSPDGAKLYQLALRPLLPDDDR
jgi:hypothetical protein